jgi:hypothetical protein
MLSDVEGHYPNDHPKNFETTQILAPLTTSPPSQIAIYKSLVSSVILCARCG